MERLTKRIKRLQKDDLIVYTKGIYEGAIPAEMTNDDIREVLKKLAAYEDLEEQGLLVRLPCKVEDIVWDIDADYPEPCKITAFSYGCHDLVRFGCDGKITFYYTSCRRQLAGIFLLSELGKTVFLTREEADKKLKELRN